MKKILTLKQVLALSAFVLISPLESNALDQGVKDGVACHRCNVNWNKPWLKCYTSCTSNDESDETHHACIESCDSKIMPQFKACVKKMVSKKAQKLCKFTGDHSSITGDGI